MSIVDAIEPLIEKTISKLKNKAFAADPIAGEVYSRVTSIVSSAYKRHGHIIERAILERLTQCPELTVWADPKFPVTENADLIVNGALKDPSSLIGNNLIFGPGKRYLQVDLLVFDRRTRHLGAYEIKRGFGPHDSGKRRQILRDTLCLQVLLQSYGKNKGHEVANVHGHVIFYYGKRSIPAPFGLIGKELDEHFNWPVYDAIEQVNDVFKSRLLAILKSKH